MRQELLAYLSQLGNYVLEITVVSQEKYEHSQYDSWTIYYDLRSLIVWGSCNKTLFDELERIQ